jgi:regulator-associated protein of mTOR
LEAWDPESSDHQKKEQAFGHQIRVSELARDELSRVDPTRIEEQVLLLKHNSRPRFMSIHPFEPHLFIAERDSFTVLSWEGLRPQEKASASSLSFPPATVVASSKNRVTIPSSSTSATASCMSTASHSSFPSITSTITSMELLNVNNMSSILALASDDGSVRIWSTDNRLCDSSHPTRVKPKMISAFCVFRDCISWQDKSMINAFASSRETSASVTPFKTVLCWEQESCCFVAGSNTSRIIKIWDASQEKVVRIIRTDSDSGVNTISSDGHNIICAGFMDGTVRTIDRREAPLAEKTRVFREHESPIVSVHLFSQDIAHLSVLSASANGEVKFWDKRLSNSIKTIALGQDLATMTVHPETDVFAW